MTGAALNLLFALATVAALATLADSAIKGRKAWRRIKRELSNANSDK